MPDQTNPAPEPASQEHPLADLTPRPETERTESGEADQVRGGAASTTPTPGGPMPIPYPN